MKTVKDIINSDYHLLTEQSSTSNQFNSVYATDLLSTAIKHIKHQEALITVIATQTTISLAVMLDIEVVVIADSIEVSKDVLSRANQEHIAILSTSLLTHEIIIDLFKRGLI